MFQFENPDKAKLYADSALSRMGDLGLAPYPDNFRLWYAYYTGRDPDLKRAIEQAVSSDPPLDDAACQQMVERFFGKTPGADAVVAAGGDIASVSRRIMQQVDGLSASARDYSDTLNAYRERAVKARSSGGIRRLIGDIVSRTSRMIERNRDLEQRLDRSASEIAALRSNLEKATNEALTDGLTGIANRRGFEQALRDAARDAGDGDEPMALLILDIDHFKRFNDTHGHQTGDEMLRLVARSLTKSIKGRDIACRYGGEEFAVILPRTPLDGARSVAEHLRAQIGGKNVVKRGSGKVLGRLTISIGAAVLRQGETLSDLVQRADAALYTAKRRGRDRVATAAE